jgi:hypothetical protein
MTLKQRVQKQLSLKRDSEELVALWDRVWTAYNNGGRRSVEDALEKLCDEIANDKEDK